jgi:hypothetical protein
MKLFKELWKRITTPPSMCPDIEVGHVKELMCDILVDYNDSDLTYEEKWILASIQIQPNTFENIEFNWKYALEGNNKFRKDLQCSEECMYDFDKHDEYLKMISDELRKILNNLIEKEEIIVDNGVYKYCIHDYQ